MADSPNYAGQTVEKTIKFNVSARIWPSGECINVEIEKKDGEVFVNGEEAEVGFDGTQLWLKDSRRYLFVFDNQIIPLSASIAQIYEALMSG